MAGWVKGVLCMRVGWDVGMEKRQEETERDQREKERHMDETTFGGKRPLSTSGSARQRVLRVACVRCVCRGQRAVRGFESHPLRHFQLTP